jgi:hypothetical protein
MFLIFSATLGLVTCSPNNFVYKILICDSVNLLTVLGDNPF